MIRRGAQGQAAVELALVLPLLAVLVLAVVQVGLVVRDHVLIGHAAREAARAAAVDPTPGVARRAAVASSSLDPERLAVRLEGGTEPGDRLRVELSYRAPTTVPVVGALAGDVTVRAEATARVE